ncbi:Do family serine endopeptidase [Altererythrobacter aquiaggeris]|uniref:Do family serine endopeptidase n=1 Tax=Aestuarierythrobacter aquiaggeris TaxID=1898396 RepID=UPI00301B6500
MRYAYGISTALLLGGAAVTLATGFPAGAQVAQNENMRIAGAVPRAGAPASFADLTEQLQPAVVNISTRQRVEVDANPFAGTPFAELFGNRGNQPQTRQAQSLGSGFIISADGYVVTNNHVVAPSGRATVEEITVTMPDGKEYPAELVGADADSDLAVLKIERGSPFPFVKFGNSGEARVGDWVIAIGNPFGLGGTVTSGIVSSVLRNTGTGGAYDRYIQTDASINRGNSGGPMFDMQGNVIGINNAIFSPSGGSVGIGFAIPADIASPIVDKLKAGREIERGFLGVQIRPLSDDLADALGLDDDRGEFIAAVEPDGAADKGGIRAGDVVVKINNREVTTDQTLSYIVANIAPGTSIPVELYRDGDLKRLNVRVAKRPSAEELRQSQMFGGDENSPEDEPTIDDGKVDDALGLQVLPINPRIARQLGVEADTQGLVIGAVDPTSDASTKGLRRGDIILSANNKDIKTADDLDGAVATARSAGREAVLLRIKRRGGPAQYVAVRMR